jgi:hypothetical protein
MNRRRHPHTRSSERFDDSDEFDDEVGLDEIERAMPQLREAIQSAKPFIDPVVNEVLPPGIIDIQQEVGCLLSRAEATKRIHHHFRDADMGYRPLGEESFKLRIRPRAHPYYGAFTGTVHVRENIDLVAGAPSAYRRFDVSGYLRYRPSILWVSVVCVFFLALLWWLAPSARVGFALFLIGAGATIMITYRLGRSERDAVDTRIAESFLRLRATIHNRR